jgi:hypothetical protein
MRIQYSLLMEYLIMHGIVLIKSIDASHEVKISANHHGKQGYSRKNL